MARRHCKTSIYLGQITPKGNAKVNNTAQQLGRVITTRRLSNDSFLITLKLYFDYLLLMHHIASIGGFIARVGTWAVSAPSDTEHSGLGMSIIVDCFPFNLETFAFNDSILSALIVSPLSQQQVLAERRNSPTKSNICKLVSVSKPFHANNSILRQFAPIRTSINHEAHPQDTF